ncbi:MAG: molybdopterin converting factor subunit 1 [Candidatus Marinimicrobia bacterium]|nr:molybdopterin converting factor subunit 1 [Candidatus Neomarinimicrobiota bacterium]
MKVKLLLFASLKDIAGRRDLEMELDDGSTLQQVTEKLASLYPEIGRMQNSVRIAINQEFTDENISLNNGDEIAFLPPMSGG